MNTYLLRYLSLTILALSFGWTGPVEAQLPHTAKLLSRANPARVAGGFGTSVAVSASYIACGEPASVTLPGRVYLYKSSNRQYLRTLAPATGAAGDSFGASVAISGKYIVVGAPMEAAARGAVYVFDATTGRQLKRLVAPDGQGGSGLFQGDLFGKSVAVTGNLIVVGAPYQNITAPTEELADIIDTGAAYAFDLITGAQLGKWTASDGATGDFFGWSVSVSGNLAAVGAFLKDAGAVYLFDAKTGTQLKKLVAADGVPNDELGYSVSIFGNKVLAGAPGNAGFGAAYLFDCATGTHGPKITFAEVSGPLRFGHSVAMDATQGLVGMPQRTSSQGAAAWIDIQNPLSVGLQPLPSTAGNRVGEAVAIGANFGVMGAPEDDELNEGAGAAYLYELSFGPKPLSLVTAKGTIAPGTGTAKYSTLSPPVISGSGAVAYVSTLTGTGAGTGTMAKGLWKEASGTHTLFGRRGIHIGETGTTTIDNFKTPIFNDDSDVLFEISMKNTAPASIKPAINSYSAPAVAPAYMFIPGNNYTGFNGADIRRFDQTVQDYDFTGAVAVAVYCKSGLTRVTTANDTAVARVDGTGHGLVPGVLGFAESQLSPIGSDVRYGQMIPRVSIMKQSIMWASTLVPGPTTPTGALHSQTSRALFRRLPGSEPELIARAGDVASAGANYNTFLAAVESYDQQPTFKVTLTGPAVTTATNEGIYRYGLGQIWRKGDLLHATDYPGVKITRVLKFWSLRHGQAILLAGLSGTKVTTANDLALILANPYDRYHVLLREGDFTEGSDGAKIGTIQKVDVEPVGSRYVVIASLTGSTTSNLALFTGRTTDFGPLPINPLLSRAGMQLRKGTAYNTDSPTLSATKITSMSITTTTDIAGAGGKGLGHAINDTGLVGLTIDFSNGIREIRKGVP